MGADSDSADPREARPSLAARSRRPLRIVAGVVACLAIGVGLAAGVSSWALAHLEHPWVKPSVVRYLRKTFELDIDYRALSFSLGSGRLRGTGLSIAQPRRFASRAAPFVVLREAVLDVDVASLLSPTTRVRSATLRGLTIVDVFDETTDSVTLLFPTDPREPVVPLSRSLDRLRGFGIDVARLEMRDVSLEAVELEIGRVARRARLESLAVRGHFHDRSGRLDVALGVAPSRGDGARLRLSQVGRAADSPRDAIDAEARVALRGSLTVGDALALSLAMHELASHGLPIRVERPLEASLGLAVGFDTRSHRTRIALRELALFGDVVHARLEGHVDDASADTLRDATGRADLAFDEPPILPAGLDARGVRASVLLDHAELSPDGVVGHVDVRGSAERASAAMQGQRLALERAALSLTTLADLASTGDTATPPPPSRFTHLAIELTAAQLSAEDTESESRAEARDAGISVHGPGLLFAPSGVARMSEATSREADVVSARAQDLVLAQGDSTSGHLVAPRLRAEGVGLIGALASSTATTGELAFAADAFAARSGIERIDVAPLEVDVSLDSFLLHGTGLFDLGGRAGMRAATSGDAASGMQRARFAELAPEIRIDFDRHTLEGSLPVRRIDVREAGVRTLSASGATFDFRARDPTTLAPPILRGRLDVDGHVDHVEEQGTAMSLPALDLAVSGDGSGYDLRGRATVADVATTTERFAGPHDVALEGRFDLRRQVVDLVASLRPHDDSRGGPSFEASLHAAIDPTTAALENQLTLETERLAPALARFLPEGARVDFRDARLRGDGRWSKLFTHRPVPGTFPEIASNRLVAIEGEERLDLVLEDLDAAQGAMRASAPTITATLRFSQRDGAALAELDASAEMLSVRNGPDELVLHDLRPRFDVRVPDVERPDVAEVQADVRVAAAEQSLVPGYPVGAVHLAATVEAAPDETTLRDFVLSNDEGHGTLRMTGTYERDVDVTRGGVSTSSDASIDGRDALSVVGELAQELGPLAGTPFARRANGRIRISFEVESGDLRTFGGVARVAADGVDFTNADGSLVIERLDGEIPIEETATLLATGPVLDPGAGVTALSRARFPDVQPFLAADAFVTAARIEWLGNSLGPLAGNLRIAGTTFSVDRLEAGYRGGSISGQLEADLMPGASHLSFRGDATGIHTARGGDEVLDANLAIRFVPESLALDGSMHLVRVGKSHLLELLDALDPYHEDSDMNTVRRLLRFGYPRFARIRASEGLMDLEVSLGGLGSAVRIDPILAIPIAPLLEEYAAPLVERVFPRAREHVVSGATSDRIEPSREDTHD